MADSALTTVIVISLRRGRPPLARPALHPVAWWLWATGLAFAATSTTNPVLLGLVLAVTGYVAVARRAPSPWARAYSVFLRLGLLVVGVRLVLYALFASSPGTHVLLDLPQAQLPHWLAGLRLGGPVTAEGLLAACYDGLRLAAILCCVGAANALTSPRRLVKSLPAALFEAGVAVTVALSVAPQAVASLHRLRVARRLRGRPERGWRALRGLLIPALEGALDGAVGLAAAMDARGFGRQGRLPVARRRAAATATVGGLLAVAASTYGLLIRGAPLLLGWPLAVAGAVTLGAGMALSARGGRTRHRPDPWRWQETLVAACGATAAVLVITAPPSVLATPTYPPTQPTLALLPLAGILLAALPAWFAPRTQSARPMPPAPGGDTAPDRTEEQVPAARVAGPVPSEVRV